MFSSCMRGFSPHSKNSLHGAIGESKLSVGVIMSVWSYDRLPKHLGCLPTFCQKVAGIGSSILVTPKDIQQV